MPRIANGAKPAKKKKPWKDKGRYMLLWMQRKRAADTGDAQAYFAADALLDEQWPARSRKPLMSARRK